MRGGHADTKKDREIKKDMRGDEKEEHEASYTRQRVLFLKKIASGPSGWIYLFSDAHTHSNIHPHTRGNVYVHEKHIFFLSEK